MQFVTPRYEDVTVESSLSWSEMPGPSIIPYAMFLSFGFFPSLLPKETRKDLGEGMKNVMTILCSSEVLEAKSSHCTTHIVFSFCSAPSWCGDWDFDFTRESPHNVLCEVSRSFGDRAQKNQCHLFSSTMVLY